MAIVESRKTEGRLRDHSKLSRPGEKTGKSAEEACSVDEELGSGHVWMMIQTGGKGFGYGTEAHWGWQEQESVEQQWEEEVVREKAPGKCLRHQMLQKLQRYRSGGGCWTLPVQSHQGP